MLLNVLGWRAVMLMGKASQGFKVVQDSARTGNVFREQR